MPFEVRNDEHKKTPIYFLMFFICKQSRQFRLTWKVFQTWNVKIWATIIMSSFHCVLFISRLLLLEAKWTFIDFFLIESQKSFEIFKLLFSFTSDWTQMLKLRRPSPMNSLSQKFYFNWKKLNIFYYDKSHINIFISIEKVEYLM